MRAAKAEDISFMMNLAADSAEAAHWAQADYERIFSPDPPQRYCLIAEQGLVGLGFIVARELAGEWEIENVVVERSARQRGTGSAMVREIVALAQAKGTKDIFLEVRESNAAARKLYESCGFELSGGRKQYYRAPEEDALLFRLSFPQTKK